MKNYWPAGYLLHTIILILQVHKRKIQYFDFARFQNQNTETK